MMELLKSECSECSTVKSTVVSLVSFCGECGLDRMEIAYEIPRDKLDEIMRDIFMILDFHRLRPETGMLEMPSYEELVKRLEI